MGVDLHALEKRLPAGASILIDTNVLIAYLEGAQEITEPATVIVDGWVRSGRNAGRISAVSAMEILVGPMRLGRPVNEYLDFLQRFPNLTCVPVDVSVARAAASVRAAGKFKPPDALIVGTAIASDVSAIVTNDAQWASKSPIPVVTLRDYVK